jgi:hypothetical protein
LVYIVPELAKPGEPQRLIGDPAGPVIDHENESAGQQQQPYQAEEAADHAPPIVLRALKIRRQPLPAESQKFNPVSHLPTL